MEKVKIGKIGENLAVEFLEKKGYEILERNVRFSKLCEIDIVAKEKDCIVFIEVKTRSSDFCGNPLEAITKTKYNNIKTGAFSYLNSKNYKKFRIDAIGITLKPKLEIKHLKNI